MITYKTLETYLEKAQNALNQIQEADEVARKAREHYRDQMIAIQSQIELTQQFMDVENNPSQVELPIAGEDNIEGLFEERLGKAELPDAKEIRSQRQEMVYKREALGIVDQIDEANNEDTSREDTTLDPA